MKGIIKKGLAFVIALTMVMAVAVPQNVEAKAKTHTVTFVYGTKMVTQQVKHGANAVVPVDTAVPGYAFSSWVGNPFNVTEDRIILGAYNKDTYTAYATAQPNVVISKYGLPVFQPQPTVRINANKTAPEPEWWKDLNIPRGVPGKTCAVHFYNGWNGEYWKTEIVPYGGSLADPGNPCLAGFEFVGWEGDWTNVTEDRCIKAYYYIYHYVKFVCSYCGNTIDTQRIRVGDNCRPVESHAYDHTIEFDHWEGRTTDIQTDGEVVAIYKK